MQIRGVLLSLVLILMVVMGAMLMLAKDHHGEAQNVQMDTREKTPMASLLNLSDFTLGLISPATIEESKKNTRYDDGNVAEESHGWCLEVAITLKCPSTPHQEFIMRGYDFYGTLFLTEERERRVGVI